MRLWRHYLSHELYLFKQNLAFPECFFYLLLFPFVLGLFLAVRLGFLFLFDVGWVAITHFYGLGLVEGSDLSVSVEGLLCFALNLIDIGPAEFVLMLFDMKVELPLLVEMLVTDIALNQP